MRKHLHFYIVLALICVAQLSFAQGNLVPNPSFETYTTCPIGPGEIYQASPWTQPTSGGTSDYFNVCNQSPIPIPFPIPGFGAPVGVPNNSLGSQQANTDSAYAGFFSIESPTDDYREYIQVPLSQPMQAGVNYCVQFYLSLSDNSTYATDGVGAYFSTGAVNTSGSGILSFTPQFRAPLVDDKTGWVELSSNVLATQNYQYLTIGNFDAIGASTVVTLPTVIDTTSPFPSLPIPGAYYYIDDVYVGTGSCPNICGVELETTTTEVTCGQADGSATLAVTGGSGVFSYAWSTGDTTESITGLAQGVYSVTVSDSIGCDVVQYVMLSENTTLDVNVNATDAGCSTLGSAEVVITGGASPFQITWENNQTTSTVSNLSPGTYTVTVIDDDGCSLVDSATIGLVSPFEIIETIVSPGCSSATGSIGVVPSGGTPPYTYLWSTNSTNGSINGLTAGTYTVTISDGSGCDGQETYTLTNVSPFTANLTQNGNTLSVTQGASYQWYFNGSLIPGANQHQYTITESGSYWVIVTNSSGCQSTSNILEVAFSAIYEEDLMGINLVLYPNPSNGSFVLDINASKQQQLSLCLRNYLGQTVYSQKLAVVSGKSVVNFNEEKLAKGTYVLEVNNGELSAFRKVLIVK